MKKLFIYKKNNNYYKDIFNFYKICKKFDQNSCFICDFKNINEKNLNNFDIIITNINNLPFVKKFKHKIYFLIDKFDNNHINSSFDYHIDPKLKFNTFDNSKNNLIFINENLISETFDIIRVLKWDTKFWRKKTATIFTPIINKKVIKRILIFIKENKIKFCSFLCNSNHADSVSLAELNKFKLTDIRLTFEKDIKLVKKIKKNKDYNFSLASKKNIKELEQIVNNIYQSSRYYYDINFNQIKVNDYYKDWIKKSVLGLFDDYCLILNNEKENRIIGFVSLKINDDNSASIGLIGVNKIFEGKGYGNIIIKNLFYHLYLKKIKKLYVVTQGRNIRAQRLYQKNDFIIKSSGIWYHKWLN